MRTLLSILMLLVVSFSAHAGWEGPFPQGTLVFRAVNLNPVAKGKIERVTISQKENEATITVFTARGACNIYSNNVAAAATLFETLHSDLNLTVICSTVAAELNSKQINTTDFAVENNR